MPKKPYTTKEDREAFIKKFGKPAEQRFMKLLESPDHPGHKDAVMFVMKRTSPPELRAMQIDMNAHMSGGITINVDSPEGKKAVEQKIKRIKGGE